jgi:hypothetical protein
MNGAKASIEDIVPRQIIHEELAREDRHLRYGATTDPFNFAASHKRLNSARSSYPFDFEDDPVTKRVRLNVKGVGDWETGLD